ncbi:MAG: queuosine precursor transporter [Desulfonauticus sp.]|nr:queuosine precursor transporter [Desulfonauticus sp.]
MKSGIETKNNFYLFLMIGVFSGSLVVSQILAAKIVMWQGVVFPAGVIAYCVTFVVTDVVSEIWGKDIAKQVVWVGFAAVIVSLILIQSALFMPAAPFWKHAQDFSATLNSTPRIVLASCIAYLCSQTHDVWAFHFWKKVTKDKHLWLRNNFSTAVSQIIDTTLFIGIAFGGKVSILPLILGQLLIKLGIALLDTPVVYLLVWFFKNTLGSQKCTLKI